MNEIIVGSVTDDATWSQIPDGSIHCVVTSPPYWALRDYGTATWKGGDTECDHHGPSAASESSCLGSGPGKRSKVREEGFTPYRGVCGKCGAERVDEQLGLEETPEQFVEHMVAVCRRLWPKLRDDGTLWLNMGDSYNSNPCGSASGLQAETKVPKYMKGQRQPGTGKSKCTSLKPKDLVGVPWLLAFALRADGWYLRQEIIWHKPNPMPESTRDRCTKAHESIFLLTKKPRYFFDQEAIKEPCSESTHQRISQDLANQVGSHRAHGGNKTNGPMKAVIAGSTRKMAEAGSGTKNNSSFNTAMALPVENRNKRSVWKVPTVGYPGAHFATFPPALIEPCILAGTSEKGVCPGCGAPWVRVSTKQRVRTRPGRHSKPYDRSDGSLVEGDEMEKPWRDRDEIGNRDPGRHISVVETTGWAPSCECYWSQYTNDFPQPKGRRKFWQRMTWLDRLKRRRAAGLAVPYPWPVVPATVFDLFFGAGTTGMVAQRHGRHWLGIELNAEYAAQALDRIDADANPTTWTKAPIPEDAKDAPLFANQERNLTDEPD